MLAALIADLDSEQFTVREKASRELEKLGLAADNALRKKLTEELGSLELRRRIDNLVDKVSVTCETVSLQTFRSVQLLEQLATPEAREILKKLAEGAKEARLTREAKASLERLARRSA